MKIGKRIITLILSLALLLASIPAGTFSVLAASDISNSDIVWGTDQGITRAEWLHNLVVVFEMMVESEALPDNYYSDLDETHTYYEDILLAVEFGVVNIEAGEKLYPDENITRAFAASTLNFCLGYQLSEQEEYTFADAADCADPASAQVALNRGWFALSEGCFLPQSIVTKEEIKIMIEDAAAIQEKTIIDESYENTYQFAEDVIVVPEDTEVTEDENGMLHITDCPVTILVGDRFAVYFNGIPVVYKAESVSLADDVTSISTSSVETEEAFVSLDAQGVLGTDAMEIVPAEGVEVHMEEDTSGISTFGVKKTKNLIGEVPIKFGGITGKASIKILNPYVDYTVTTERAYVALCGEAEITYGLYGNAMEAAGLKKGFTVFTVNIAGVGSFDVNITVDFSGSASGTVKGFLMAGVECEKGSGVRLVKNFIQKSSYTNVEATTAVGLRVSLGVTKMPVLSGFVYADVGIKANFARKTYQDETLPHSCKHFAAYLYASYGASVSVDFKVWKVTENLTYTIYDQNNSPVRIVNHYEDGVLVPSCTRGTQTMKYFTTATSRWSGSGWSSANSAYALNADGSSFALYDYTLDQDNQATITKYNGNSWSVYIPETIDGYTVVAIGSNAFAGKDSRYITIPDTVVRIGSAAFAQCKNLQTVKLSNSLVEIERQAFFDCGSLSEIELPKSLTTLGAAVFKDCDSLTEIRIPKALTICGSDTWGGPFARCSSLKTVNFEEGITQIPGKLFVKCDGLEEISIPDTVTIVGPSAFSGCENLQTVKLSNSLAEIEMQAFFDCGLLSEIELPKTLTTLGAAVFKDCDSITEICIPKGLTICGSDTWGGPFARCSGLKTVSFEENTTAIPSNLFSYCDGLEEISIPDTVISIGSSAFARCFSLQDICLPSGITKIETATFRECTSLAEIGIPDTVTNIQTNAFYDCTALKSLTLPNSVTSLERNSFYNCASLENVVLSQSMNGVADAAFAKCTALRSIEIPAAVEKIFTGAFSGCTSLETISFVEGTKLEEIWDNAFGGCTSLKEIALPKTVESIGVGSFQNCTALEKVSLPQSLKTIGSSAFMGCENLCDVNISDYSITEIRASTFKDCSALVSIVLPKGLMKIGSQAFMNDTLLVNVTIPESVTSIDSTAFSYPAKTTIYGKIGSYAETFANNGGFTFKDNSIPVEGIILKDGVENVTLDGGETYRAEFEVYPEDANDVITLTANNSNVTINGHDIYARNSGDTVITATSTSGLTYEFNIHIRSVRNIDVITQPKKTSYIMGEEFDKTGMVVQVNYYDGSSKTVEDYTLSGFDSSAEGTSTVTVKWKSAGGSIYSTTFAVEILDPAPKLTGIYIDTLPEKVNYELREKLDVTGLVVKGTYTDNSTKELTDYTVSGYNALKSGSQIITITYGDYTATFTVSVGAVKTLSSVSVAQAPAKTEYYIGDALNTDGLQLTLSYSDNSTSTVSSGFTISGYDASSAGEKTITVTYEGLSTTFVVTVKTPGITLSAIETELVVGNTVTLTATTDPKEQGITWISSNESVATVRDGIVTTKAEGTAIVTAKFTYNGQEYSQACTVSVSEPKATLTAIDIVSEPSKTVYYIGDNLVTDGLQVKLTYSDSSTDTVTTGYSVTGFSSTTAGTKTVTVSYGGFTDTFVVTVKTPSITLSSNAETLTVGEDVILSATTLPSGQSVVWTSSSNSVATVNNGTVVAEGAGTAVITAKFTYNGVVYSATCSITVESIPVTLTSISVNTQPSKTVYEIGESLDTIGLVLKLTYSDGSNETVTSGFTTSGFSSATAGTKTVIVQYGELTTSFVVTVNASEPGVDENAPQIVLESKKVTKGKEFTVTAEIINNPGFSYLEVTPVISSALTLVKVENGELISDFTKGKQYVWIADEDVTDDGVLLTFTFTVDDSVEPGNYQVSFNVRTCGNYDEEVVTLNVVVANIEVINYVYGDATGDGVVDGFDVIRLKKYLANYDYDTESSTTDASQGADANGDGKIDGFDVIRLKKYLANYDYETGESTVVLGPQ